MRKTKTVMLILTLATLTGFFIMTCSMTDGQHSDNCRLSPFSGFKAGFSFPVFLVGREKPDERHHPPFPLSKGQQAESKPGVSEAKTGYWQDVWRPVTYYWLSDERGNYEVFDDRLSWFNRIQQLRLQGISFLEGSDSQSRKIGRIYMESEADSP